VECDGQLGRPLGASSNQDDVGPLGPYSAQLKPGAVEAKLAPEKSRKLLAKPLLEYPRL
jgi:hypothetical protein